ncbi:MAG: NAD(P)-dependent oxidoreductase [Gammaproteobacteria bacterium]|nr:NAD(P)-dependent oxidoreductase [Gammaproteobacteria bacterium]
MGSQVGFIGLGSMGLGMSANLAKAGFSVQGYDIDANKCAAFAQRGGQLASTPAAAAADVEVLMVCVFSAKEALPLLAAHSGVLDALPAGATIVMHTTMSPSESAALARGVEANGFYYLEAPVTGGQSGADNGTLTAIVSGTDNALSTARPALDAMCARVYHVGQRVGAAGTVKMVNQLLVGVHVAAAAEAMALAVRAGADPHATYEVIRNGGGNSNAFTNRVPRMLAGEPEAARTVDIFLKDLGIVQDAARELRMPLPLSASAYQLFLAAAALGANKDAEPSVAALFETLADIDIAAAAKEKG